MKNDPIYAHLRELSWRRKLTAAEESQLRDWLMAHPEAEADWETEARLNAALSRLPDAPVASNFTARVLQAVERDAVAPHRPGRKWGDWLRLRWLPKAAVTATLLCAGIVSCLLVQDGQRRKMVESVAAVSAVSSMPSPEILKDFDAIRASNPSPLPDEKLLAVLQ
jgi:anti-sigma factor RsiW